MAMKFVVAVILRLYY